MVVRFEGKKSIKHYIGCITNIIDSDNYEIKFLRKCKKTCFVYPLVDDIVEVEQKYIKQILNAPVIDKRSHHFFKMSSVSDFENLC